jgi:hypothetical protein
MKLWICGQSTGIGREWEFQGAFSSEMDAIAACKNERFFIGPANLNEKIPTRSIKWPGC